MNEVVFWIIAFCLFLLVLVIAVSFAVVFIFRFFLCFERFCFGTCDEKKPKEVKPNAVLKSFDKRKVSLKKSDESLPTDK